MNIYAGRVLRVAQSEGGTVISIGFDKAGAPESHASTANGKPIPQQAVVQAVTKAAAQAADNFVMLHTWLRAITMPHIVAPPEELLRADLRGVREQ